jgi:hypothetical protein
MTKVTTQFIGRLGNGMFQTAACIGYAKKYNVGWAVPKHNNSTIRFHEYFPKLNKQTIGFQKYEEHPHGRCDWYDYHEIPFHPNGVLLKGFFQSLKYFENAQDEVKDMFELPHVEGLEDVCSIHVRRGDYVGSTNFPAVTVAYIEKAMAEMSSRGHNKFLVFSDGLDWCKANINGDYEIKFSDGKGEFEDLYTMASCGHNIIANSSYSWWGAYLNLNPNKVIVSPAQGGNNWYGPDWDNKNPNKPKTLVPDGWIQIEFR